MKIAPSGGQISTFFTSSPPNGQKIPPTNFCHTQCSFAEENFEFEPLSQANLDTHYPHPKPTALNEQMGAYPPTHTRPKFPVGADTHHPPIPKKARVQSPDAETKADRSV